MIRQLGLAVLAVALVGVAQQSSAAPIVYVATLTGPGENPPNNSTATGSAEVDFDPVTQLMHVHVTFSGITSLTTASHIHSPAIPPGVAGVATTVPSFPGFPLGVSSGTFDNTFDMTQASSYNPAFVTSSGGTVPLAEAAWWRAWRPARRTITFTRMRFPVARSAASWRRSPSRPASCCWAPASWA